MFNKKPSAYTTVFTYTDRFSVMASSINDVDISHKHNIIGKSNPAGKPYLGDKVLVVGQREKGVYLFATEVGEFVKDSRKSIWYDQGGNLWDFNYLIGPKTNPVFMTWKEIAQLTGAEGNDIKRIFLDRYRPRNPDTKISKLGEYRDILYSYLKKNTKNT
jgi:hypothetical protein